MNTSPTAGGSDNYFKALRSCAMLSFAMLIGASALRFPPWVAMIGGAAPLVYYHLGFLARRAHMGLSQAAIDSVYYFGFLVTIGALGVSAVMLALSGGKEPLANIAFQFGLGLIATGYAVLARMHLTSISTGIDDTSPEAVMDRYVARSRELVTNVELASAQFVELSRNLMNKSQEVAETARQASERSMLEVARSFDEQLRNTMESSRQGLAEIRSLVSETSFVQEREALVRSVQATLEVVDKLNVSLGTFAQQAQQGALSAQKSAMTTDLLSSSVKTFQIQLDQIGGPQGPMLGAAKSLAQAQAEVASSTHTLASAMQELGGVAASVKGVGKAVQRLEELTTSATAHISGLAATAEKLGSSAQQLDRSAAATESWAGSLDRVSQSLPALAERVGQLEVQFGSLATATSAVEHHLGGLPRPVEAAIVLSTDLAASLQSVATALASASVDAKVLAGHSAEHIQSLEDARRMAKEVGALQSTADSLNSLLAKLGSTVGQLHGDLSMTTQTLNSAMAKAASSLETDVQRSTNAARLFSERMTDVAQIVIDRTREARPS